jgi:chemotaxis signal transduction protein
VKTVTQAAGLERDRGLTLRFRAGGKHFAFGLTVIDAVVGYAKLGGGAWSEGPAFVGRLEYRGTEVPVYDLGVHLGGEQTPMVLSSRIMLFARPGDSSRRVGLLAAEITDTTEERDLQGAELLQPEPLLRALLGEMA